MVGKTEGRRRQGQQRIRWLDSIINLMDMSLSKLQEIVKDMKAWGLQSMGKQRVRIRWLDSIINLMDMSLNKLQDIVKDREAWHLQSMAKQRVRHSLATEQQQQNEPGENICK